MRSLPCFPFSPVHSIWSSAKISQSHRNFCQSGKAGKQEEGPDLIQKIRPDAEPEWGISDRRSCPENPEHDRSLCRDENGKTSVKGTAREGTLGPRTGAEIYSGKATRSMGVFNSPGATARPPPRPRVIASYHWW